jgi:hypothetical protein
MLLPDRRLLLAAGLWLWLGLAVAAVPNLLASGRRLRQHCSAWPLPTR